MWLLALWACTAAESDPVCDRYVSCAGTISAQDAAEAEARYAAGGSCFQGYDVPTCADECEVLLVDAWWASAAAEGDCDPAAVGIEPVMDREAFSTALLRKFCDTWERCTGDPDICSGVGATTGVDCDVDQAAAEACLASDWGCDPAGAFPVLPAVCSDACVYR